MRRVNILRHNCGQNSFANMIQQLMGEDISDKCPFYWRMKGGKNYMGSIHYFTLFGFRLVLKLHFKKSQTTLGV